MTNPYDTVASVVQIAGGAAFLSVPASSTQTIRSWGMGRQYTSLNDEGNFLIGDISPAPIKPASLVNSQSSPATQYFTRSKPQYQSLPVSSFIVVTANSVKNDGTGDQTTAINSILARAGSSIVFFPQGVYRVEGTIKVVSLSSRLVH